MKYQALILIFIILISSYILKQGDVFSKQQDDPSKNIQANALLTGSDIFETPKTNQDDTIQTNSADVNKEGKINSIPEIIPENKIDVSERSTIESINFGQDCDGVGAMVYLVSQSDQNSKLFQKNLDYRWPIASVTKLMTAIVAIDNIDLKAQIEITQDVKDAVGDYGNFSVGSKYSTLDMIKSGMVFSSNDAAFALSKYFGQEKFIQKMNDKAKEIGMSQTSFYEPSGLSYLNQSTIYDLETLLKFIYNKYPSILEFTRQKTVSIKELTSGKSKIYNNIDQFAGRKEFVGGKTGYIDQSGGNLVTLFQKNGKLSFIGVLGSQDRFADVDKLFKCIK